MKSVCRHALLAIVLVAGAPPTVLAHEPGEQHVEINVHPGSDPNTVYATASGVIPVAILGSEEFDVLTIVPDSLELASTRVKIVGGDRPLCHVEDIGSHDTAFFDALGDPDGHADLVCQFRTEDIRLVLGIVQYVHLTGEFIDPDGSPRPFVGFDLANEPTVLDGRVTCCIVCTGEDGNQTCSGCNDDVLNCPIHGDELRVCDQTTGTERTGCERPRIS